MEDLQKRYNTLKAMETRLLKAKRELQDEVDRLREEQKELKILLVKLAQEASLFQKAAKIIVDLGSYLHLKSADMAAPATNYRETFKQLTSTLQEVMKKCEH